MLRRKEHTRNKSRSLKTATAVSCCSSNLQAIWREECMRWYKYTRRLGRNGCGSSDVGAECGGIIIACTLVIRSPGDCFKLLVLFGVCWSRSTCRALFYGKDRFLVVLWRKESENQLWCLYPVQFFFVDLLTVCYVYPLLQTTGAEVSVNQIPPWSELCGDIRLTPFYKVTDVMDTIQGWVKELNETDFAALPKRGPVSNYVITGPDGNEIRAKLTLTFEGQPFKVKCYALC